MDGLFQLVPVLGIAVIFWLLVIRPGVRRERERRAMQGSLAVGDRIVLTSGFFATIVALHDDRADIELTPGTTVTVALGAVGGLDPAHDRAAESAPVDLNKTNADAQSSTTPKPEEI